MDKSAAEAENNIKEGYIEMPCDSFHIHADKGNRFMRLLSGLVEHLYIIINSCDMKTYIGQSYSKVSSATANIQYRFMFVWFSGAAFDKIELSAIEWKYGIIV